MEALSGPSSGLRVGWSSLKSSLQLGQVNLLLEPSNWCQDANGFAYDLQGLCWTNGKSEPFGEVISVGDEIGCFLSFTQQTISFSYVSPLNSIHSPGRTAFSWAVLFVFLQTYRDTPFSLTFCFGKLCT